MVMSRIWTGLLLISMVSACINGSAGAMTAALLEGAQSGVTLAISMTGSICLWSGVGALMHRTGLTEILAGMLKPLLRSVFPESAHDTGLARSLSGNICANLLGLGNAATPMGIDAAKRLRSLDVPDLATDSLCRLVVLNTASIQLIPSNVAALRLGLGCASPFDILPAVWITSFASAGLGLAAACVLGRVWKYD